MRVYRPYAAYCGGRLWWRPSILVDEKGCWIEITEAPLEGHELKGLLFPSFFNMHTHLEFSHVAGKIPPGSGMRHFIEAMRQVAPAQDLSFALSALQKAFSEGTAYFFSHQNTPIPQTSFSIRGVAEVLGLSRRRVHQAWQKALSVGLPLSPHSLYALSGGLWRKLFRQWKGNPPAYVSMHFMESPEEWLWLRRRRGPLKSFFRSLSRRPYVPPISRILRRIAQLTPQLLLVHNFVLPAAWRARLRQLPTRVYFVLCPRSNYHLFRMLPALDMWRQDLDRVVIGTDSLASSTSLSVTPEIQFLYQAGWAWDQIGKVTVDNPRSIWGIDLEPYQGGTLLHVDEGLSFEGTLRSVRVF
ncbi:MAG: amidohydrolase family protein [Bacteroidia bacterium]